MAAPGIGMAFTQEILYDPATLPAYMEPTRDLSKVGNVSVEGTQVVLYPVTALQNPRYDLGGIVRTGSQTIRMGTHTSMRNLNPSVLPDAWATVINPEGSPFYVTECGAISVVTDSPIQEAGISEKLAKGIGRVRSQIEDLAFKLPRNAELYIRADKIKETCSYYFVDHDSQTEFWLQDIEMTTMGMPEVSSVKHIKYILQEHYWTHVEFFPHRLLPKHLRVELVDVLRHARADQMTSDNSTFPYNAQQCADFIQIIDTEANETTVYMTCLVARIWVMIARHRYDHFYGEEHARLCRDQGILGKPAAQLTFGMRFCSALLFNFPNNFRVELELLYVDNLVYTIHWRTFVTELTKGWRDNVKMDVGLLIANAAFMGLIKDTPSMYAGLASMLLAMGGLLSAGTLLHSYANAGKVNAATVAVYLRQMEHSKLGFGPVAGAFSLPKAFTVWSILFFFTGILTIVPFVPDPFNMGALICVAFLVAVAFVFMAVVLRRPSVRFIV
ncbi:hypothetical protein OBBRIDRAFT_363125 [Obba rivulosa]|uniref:Uncharacterized protein n=1 Tax=Obba rivulosa TaxID=1052685 RepID=A0A8E2J841_9APHY|nr:hypothetical protein OBBRIDRAFT_363125 [Obba rivulosa]